MYYDNTAAEKIRPFRWKIPSEHIYPSGNGLIDELWRRKLKGQPPKQPGLVTVERFEIPFEGDRLPAADRPMRGTPVGCVNKVIVKRLGDT